ncbi:uncharacterized protein G2W53_044595 [Senna tora]|uniref:Transposase n=1 Tax=Senna tora TaxID=362788 RepID=A0A834SCZ3_9FABA|nr:uncharacterized protein G2W53_044595 [Senna tora]
MYVLENCEEVWPFIKEHQDELEKQTPRVDDMNGVEFQNWFRAHLFKLSTQEFVSEELISLAVGPLQKVRIYSTVMVNGYRFQTQDRALRRKTQNSGVLVKGDTSNTDKEYYGVLENVYELNYVENRKVYLFKCHWRDVAHFERGYKVDKYGFLLWTNPHDLFDVPQEDKEDDGDCDGVAFDQAYQPIEVDQLNFSNHNEVENEITVTLHRVDVEPQTISQESEKARKKARKKTRKNMHTSSEVNFIDDSMKVTGFGRGRGGRGSKVSMRSIGRGRRDNQEVSSTPRSIPLQEVPRVEDQHQISPVAQRGFQSFPDIIEEEIEGSQIGEGSINPSEGSCTYKHIRGKYKSLSLDMKTRNGQKVKINIPEGLQRAVGLDVRDIASYCGFVLRQTVSFKVGRWQNVFATYGQAMCLKVKEKFEILDDRRALAMDTFVIDTLQRLFRAWKNRLHTHYKMFPTDQERLDNRPTDVTPEDWNWLVEHYSSDTFKVSSERNKRNRAKQVIRHTSGPRSFAEVEELTRDPATGEKATPDAVWEIQHTHKTNGGRVWLDPKSKEIHGRLKELVCQQKDNQHPLTGDEILEFVLGEKLGYVRGKGYGKKPITKRARQQIDVEASVSSAIEIQEERVEYECKLQEERNELQLKEQEKHAELEHKMQAEIDQRIQAQLTILMSNFQ